MIKVATVKWDTRFMQMAGLVASWSKDPSRKVGAVVVSPTRRIVATGYNGLPVGVEDKPERLERPLKYEYTVHAEVNAILQCARHGASPAECTLYSTLSPCTSCAGSIIQSGISRVVSPPFDANAEPVWVEKLKIAVAMMREAGLVVDTYAP